MGTSYTQPGDVLEFTAPTGGVTKGVPAFMAGVPVIPLDTALVGVTFRAAVVGVHTLPKTTSETWAQGQPAFWDPVNSKISNDPAVGQLPIGVIAAAATSSDTTGSVRLNGVSLCGRTFTFRRRLAVATINAGATLLAAIAGLKYRLVDAYAIAVGGAVTSNTTVDLKGTQTTAQKLVAFTQASLTQSTMVRAGAAGGTLLADGASFAPCDANTAITIANTGSAITVATSVDIAFTVSIE